MDKHLDNFDLIDICLTCISFLIGVISPNVSIVVGAILYHVYMRERLKIEVKVFNLLSVIFIATAIGYYFIPLVDLFLISEGFNNSKITPAIGFIIGVFGEPILTYFIINSKKIVYRYLDKIFKL